LRQVFLRLANVSRPRRPSSLRVPPLILRRLTYSRMSPSLKLLCNGNSGRSRTKCRQDSSHVDSHPGSKPHRQSPSAAVRDLDHGGRCAHGARCSDVTKLEKSDTLVAVGNGPHAACHHRSSRYCPVTARCLRLRVRGPSLTNSVFQRFVQQPNCARRPIHPEAFRQPNRVYPQLLRNPRPSLSRPSPLPDPPLQLIEPPGLRGRNLMAFSFLDPVRVHAAHCTQPHPVESCTSAGRTRCR